MSKTINRRNFLKSSAALAFATGTKNLLGSGENPGRNQEYYEIRIYRTKDATRQKRVETYLQSALLPALGRMGIGRIGVFTNMETADDFSVYVLIPYATLETFAAVNPKLQADNEYLKAASDYFSVAQDDPVFTRIHSRFYKAFAGMPVIELPAQTEDNKPRMFELRIYESHTEEKAALKVDMFNSGEIQVMRDTGLAPVFYGEALIGDDVPHLAYMTSAADRESHKEHWSKFSAHPEWQRMKVMDKYKDTVSKNTKYFLVPTPFSQI